ncbi:hypothetical protein GH714_008223 [Hevea brasiliensis]|uniref:FHA domain-containing protein n=1 Tax=Hevea brasiliensis TaxID=3981 RepID=A0A6A6KAE4_HEVBR|nr:hypothetical protein GH714_008223 [Hevea brasiliensis]
MTMGIGRLVASECRVRYRCQPCELQFESSLHLDESLVVGDFRRPDLLLQVAWGGEVICGYSESVCWPGGGVTLLFNEPPDARKPDIRWRLYVFKNGEVLNGVYALVLSVKQVEKEPDGTLSKQVGENLADLWPYLMDLGSTNKTFINDNPIEPQRYYELFEKDTIKFEDYWRYSEEFTRHYKMIRKMYYKICFGKREFAE